MSTPVTGPASRTGAASSPARPIDARASHSPLPDDGTRPLLTGAFWTLGAGLLAALLTKFGFGGIGMHGPHTSAGWLSLIVAMMCLPFGIMLLALGGAKYLRNRRIAKNCD